MCELFAMSAKYPSTVKLSLEEFSRHGGLSGPHKDGWGIAWYNERGIRLVKEALPAADSPCVRFIQSNPIVSSFVISHVRKATWGALEVRNCQPFVRELGGVWHGLAHNGDRRVAPEKRRQRKECQGRDQCELQGNQHGAKPVTGQG
jgi:predicted glutamine amidotransferase